MAQLNSSVVQGSLRVIDTTYTTDLIINNTTAPTIATNDYLLLADNSDSNKILKGPALNTSNTSVWLNQAGAWSAPTKTTVGLSNVTNDAQVKASLGTAQGDMLYWSAASTPARLAKGGANTILTASGTSQNPAWTSTAATITSATSTTANTAAYANLTLGNSANVSTTTAHSEGQVILYSAATAAHTIKGASTTTAYTSTLPNNTGILVSLSGGTAKGSTTKPIYVPNTGIVTECSIYAGGTKVTLNSTDKGASDASFYAPTSAGTANQILVSAGGTSAPTWKATANGAAYATSENGELTFGILPIAQGGTGASGRADGEVLIGKSETNNSITTTTLEWRVLKGSDLTTAIQYYSPTDNAPTPTTDVVPGTIWLRPTSVSIEDLKCLVVQLNNISGDGSQQVTATYNSASINQHMVVVGYSISNPAAVVGNLTWTTADANPTLTVQGYINGNTNIILYLLPERGE